MEMTLMVLKFMLGLLSGLWWMNDQLALASPFPLCDWNSPQKSGKNDDKANQSRVVNCSGLGLRSVPSGLPSQIKTLDLGYNNITVIRCSEFTHHSHGITELIFSHNFLEKIDEGALSSLLALKELNLSRNSLALVTEGMFWGLKNLKVLDLRYNQIHWIHKMAFTDLANLEVLWLQNNNLHAVPDAVNSLTGLKALSLATNQLSQLLIDDLRHCTDLKILQLQDNLISTLAIGALLTHENLKTVDLSSNQLKELHDTTVKFLWERGVNLHLHGNPLRCDCASGQTSEGAVWLTDAVLCQGIRTLERESLQGVRVPLRVHTTITVQELPEQSLTMPCKASSNTGMVLYWKTPVGWLTSQNSCNSRSDLKCLSNGNLTIVNLSCQHSGLYYCFQENNQERVISPFRVQALGSCQHPMAKSRLPREVKVDGQDIVSDSHFAAAVASSVLVTFLGGFVLGAFSRSHLITCLQRAKACLGRKGAGTRQGTSEDHVDQISMETSPAGFSSTGEGISLDGDAPSTTPSPPAKAPRSFRSKREQPRDSTHPESSASEDGSNSVTSHIADQEPSESDLQPADRVAPRPAHQEPSETDLQPTEQVAPRPADQEPSETDLQPTERVAPRPADQEPSETDLQPTEHVAPRPADQEPSETDLQPTEQVAPRPADQEPSETDLQPKERVAPRPARRSRVIKLYNYDEDGQHYGHIKEPVGDTDGAPQPKQRTKSLNRLSAIMSSVETPDPSTPTQPDMESEPGNSSEDEGSVSGRLHIQLES